MTAFEIREEIGRDKAIKLFPNYQLVKSPDLFSHWDISGCTTNVAGETKEFLIEVKDRDITSKSVPDIFMEWYKYQELLKLSEANNDADIFYLSMFSDNIAYIYNLKKLKVSELVLEVRKVKKTTVEDSEIIDKLMVLLPFNKAQIKKLK
ncbi:hypothetical protein BDD43_2819 [Mucilaginibacter gracilis]|uniref:Protein NO VEIN C-terminal domain-containing protein n=1 Tax=Mucilaginibacter gracilis TaxID=423350 RepID=A0A495J2R1_9SPHI|nr:hypothetical protein [Mucilaginibacter gracilis]RKR82634.1 hypothetical protein BDD43_2819 [Mucilaginibacter gracilis]